MHLMRVFLSSLLAGAALAIGLAAQSVPTSSVKPATIGPLGDGPAFASEVPVVAEHHYRMAGKIRMLLPWVGPDNVGGARIAWRRSADGTRGWELLLGSDPDRAPRHINRWGYIREEGKDGDVSMLGVMKQSDEQSISEARRQMENESKNGYAYKLIRSRVTDGESSSTVATAVFPRDFTYRDLSRLLRGFESQPVKAGAPKRVHIGQSARPGFLVAVADLVHDSVYAFKRSGAAGLTQRTVTYAYNGRIYDLKLNRPDVQKNARYGDRTYATLIKGWFEVRNPAGGSSEWFQVVWGVDGGLEEVPVYLEYQPRWWFKATLVLDERERF